MANLNPLKCSPSREEYNAENLYLLFVQIFAFLTTLRHLNNVRYVDPKIKISLYMFVDFFYLKRFKLYMKKNTKMSL